MEITELDEYTLEIVENETTTSIKLKKDLYFKIKRFHTNNRRLLAFGIRNFKKIKSGTVEIDYPEEDFKVVFEKSDSEIRIIDLIEKK